VATARPDNVEQEIEEMSMLGPRERLHHVKLSQSVTGGLLSETLVFLFRQARDCADNEALKYLVPVLMMRCARLASGHSAGFRPEHRNAIEEEMVSQFIERLVRDHRIDFFECRFNLAFQRLAVDVRRRAGSRYSREEEAHDPQEDAAVFQLPAAEAERFKNPENRAIMRNLLDRLPEDERQVFVFHYFAGCSQGGQDKDSIANIMGRSERWVRGKLRSAEQRLELLQRERQ